MVLGTDSQVLMALGDMGGKAHVMHVAAKLGLSTQYCELICYNLGRHDYINFKASGVLELMEKGYQALRAKGWRSPDEEEGEETAQAIPPIGAERFLGPLRQKMERGEITREEYQQTRAEIIARIARGAKW